LVRHQNRRSAGDFHHPPGSGLIVVAAATVSPVGCTT